MHVLVTYKNEGARVATICNHFKCLVIIPKWELGKSELIQAFMIVLITCKNEKKSTQKWKHLSSHNFEHRFSDAQWQLTP